MKTTLNKIRKHSPCERGWTNLLRNLGKTKADDEPLTITTILDINGVDDALWCLQAVDGYEKEIRLMAVDFARSVQHLITDKRSLDAIDVAERYANGQATVKELDAAKAACDAAWYVAKDAAWDAASDAAWAAARAAARAAAVAASAAVSDAAAAAAWADADWDDAREVQADYLRIVCAEIEQREGVV